MEKIVVDTETCGFHGPIVLLQFSTLNESKVHLHETFREPIDSTLAIIDWISENAIIGFNLAFDWFHLCQMYTTLQVYKDRYPHSEYIDPERYALCEPFGRDEGCLKPGSACDVMVLARNTKYQSLMDRKQITIRRIPMQMAALLTEELNGRITFDPIYFDRRKDKSRSIWQYKESDKEGYSNIYVKFAPSSRLKALAKDALGLEDDPMTLDQIAMNPNCYPLELGYAPYALAVCKLKEWKGERKRLFKGKWRGSWPSVIEDHITYWGYRATPREYAANDVVYTKELYKYFGAPEPGDDDSILSCMVGAVRWKGYKVNLDRITELRVKAAEKRVNIPTAPAAVLRYFAKVLDPIEQAMVTSTNKETLHELQEWKDFDSCPECEGEGCDKCPSHPVSELAHLVEHARKAGKEIELYDKLIIADRLHASFRVFGTLSNRMAGADKLNTQGIKRVKEVRRAFTLAFPGFQLDGGDFDSFEVGIADAIYDEPKLRQELLSFVNCVFCNGTGKLEGKPCKDCEGTGKERKKIHAIFGTFIFPGETYESIRKSAKTANDMYTTAKSGLFTWIYAGTEYSFQKRLGIPYDQAKHGLQSFGAAFPNVGKKRAETMALYAPLSQPDGRGTKIYWSDHKTSVATLLGFERRFDLEFQVIKGLYTLAQDLPDQWRAIDGLSIRYEAEQTLGGAIQSALYSAAFSLQGRVSRAAINTPIQGTGAQITKRVQCDIWTVQPSGYRPWRVIPMQIHDEVLTPVLPSYSKVVAEIVSKSVEKHKSIVPLLSIDWKQGMKSWAGS